MSENARIATLTLSFMPCLVAGAALAMRITRFERNKSFTKENAVRILASILVFILSAFGAAATAQTTPGQPATTGTQPTGSDKKQNPDWEAVLKNNEDHIKSMMGIKAPSPEAGDSSALRQLMQCGDLNYLPVPPFKAETYTFLKTNSGELAEQPFKGTNREINDLLPNLSMDVSNEVLSTDSQGFAFFKTTVEHRRIIMDFTKSRTEPIMDSAQHIYGYGRVGAGLRLKIDVRTTDTSLDGSLIGLAAAAKAKTAYGTISAETIGVNNPDVTLSMPFTVDFSEGSVQKVIEALAVIKSRLHDEKNTTLVPHFLARFQCAPAPSAPSQKV